MDDSSDAGDSNDGAPADEERVDIAETEDGAAFVERYGEASYNYFQEFTVLSDERRRGLNALFEESYNPRGSLDVAARGVGKTVYESIGLTVLSVAAYALYGIIGVGAVIAGFLLLFWVALFAETDSVDAVAKYPEVHELFEDIVADMVEGGATVNVSIVDSEEIGAMARPQGVGKGEVIISEGALDSLDIAEVETVLRHEVGHVTSPLFVWRPVVGWFGRSAVLALPVVFGVASLEVLALMIGLSVVLRVALNFETHREEVRADARAVEQDVEIEYAEALLKIGPIERTSVSFMPRLIEILFGSPHPPLVERVETALGGDGSVRVPASSTVPLLHSALLGVGMLGIVGGMAVCIIGLLSFVEIVPFVWAGYGLFIVAGGLVVHGAADGALNNDDGDDAEINGVGGIVSSGVSVLVFLGLVFGVLAVISLFVGPSFLSVVSWIGIVVAVLLELLILLA